jgi:hypothetical protein
VASSAFCRAHLASIPNVPASLMRRDHRQHSRAGHSRMLGAGIFNRSITCAPNFYPECSTGHQTNAAIRCFQTEAARSSLSKTPDPSPLGASRFICRVAVFLQLAQHPFSVSVIASVTVAALRRMSSADRRSICPYAPSWKAPCPLGYERGKCASGSILAAFTLASWAPLLHAPEHLPRRRVHALARRRQIQLV